MGTEQTVSFSFVLTTGAIILISLAVGAAAGAAGLYAFYPPEAARQARFEGQIDGWAEEAETILMDAEVAVRETPSLPPSVVERARFFALKLHYAKLFNLVLLDKNVSLLNQAMKKVRGYTPAGDYAVTTYGV